MYKGSFFDKFNYWYQTYYGAYDSRWNQNDPNRIRQFINFSSLAGGYPSDNAAVINEALHDWLSATNSDKDKNGGFLGGQNLRTGIGVIPMDFPTQENINLLIRANFNWTYRIIESSQGVDYLNKLLIRLKNA